MVYTFHASCQMEMQLKKFCFQFHLPMFCIEMVLGYHVWNTSIYFLYQILILPLSHCSKYSCYGTEKANFSISVNKVILIGCACVTQLRPHWELVKIIAANTNGAYNCVKCYARYLTCISSLIQRQPCGHPAVFLWATEKLNMWWDNWPQSQDLSDHSVLWKVLVSINTHFCTQFQGTQTSLTLWWCV